MIAHSKVAILILLECAIFYIYKYFVRNFLLKFNYIVRDRDKKEDDYAQTTCINIVKFNNIFSRL